MNACQFAIPVIVLLVASALAAGQPTDPAAEDVAQLIRTAGGDDSQALAAARALAQLAELGLQRQVVPVLAINRDNLDLAVIELQLAAVRVLARANFREALDNLGTLLETRRYFVPGDSRIEAQRKLTRETFDTIYALARRQNPAAKDASPDAVDALTAPTLRMLSILKPADARRTPWPADDPRNGARVRLHLDRNEWLLGESVTIHFEVKNEGQDPFKVEFGGDYRAAGGRALRFKVLAFNEAGELVDDPYPARNSMGGIGGERELKTGESYWDLIPLWLHCSFSQPGTYTIRVYHDLGWDKRDVAEDSTQPPLAAHLAPVVEAKITFREPTPDEARQVIAAVISNPRNNDRSWGKRGKSFGDITSVNHPVYLPILLERIEAGEIACLEAIGGTPSPESTGALVKLASHSNKTVADRSLQLLIARLPAAPSHWTNRQWLAERAWRDEFRGPTLAFGWQLLESIDRDSISRGADIIHALGGKEDLPRMIAIVDRVLEAFRNDRQEQEPYPRPATASGKVIPAAWALLARGGTPPTRATTAASGLVMLRAIVVDKEFRPTGWIEEVRGLLQHPIPYVRATTLENLPRPVPAELHDEIVALISDRFAPVQAAACQPTTELKLPAAVPPLLALLRTAPDHWRISDAYHAAAACGVTPDRLTEICAQRLVDAQRLPDKDMLSYHIFRLMTNVLDVGGGSSGSQIDWSVAPRLQVEWQKLIAAERVRIAASEKLPLDQPPVTPALFPRGFSVTRREGGAWPDWSAIPKHE